MKILKTILYLLLALIAIWLIAAAFIDGKCHFEKSVSINATPDKVWSNTNSLKAMDTWSPWNKLDPNMKKDWTGNTGQVGEKVCWEGNEQAGKGCQEVAKIDAANRKIDTKIVFLTPYESENFASVNVVPEGAGSKATWTFSSEIPYPWSVTKLMYDLEEMIGKDYMEGLNNLKALSENLKLIHNL